MEVTLIQIDLVMGARVLLSILLKRGYKAKALQINIKYTETLSDEDLEIIYKYTKGSDIVGISFNTFYALIAQKLGVFLKRKGINYIIAGGNHATAFPEEVITYADVVIKYEAEMTLLNVLDALKNKKNDLSKIKGIVYKNGDTVVDNNDAPEIVFDLDSLPFQSLDTNLIKYFNLNKKLYTPEKRELFPSSKNTFFLLASRGCPFKCTYCSNSLYHKLDKKFALIRKRSVDNIIEEMKYALENGFESFYITDDHFFSLDLTKMEVFSKKYKKEIKKPFSVVGINPNNFRSQTAEEKLKLLLSCGLSDIRIGVQSGSDKTLGIFNRGYKSADVPKLLAPLEKNRKTIWGQPYDKLHVALDFICDPVWENSEDKIATIKLALRVLNQYSIFFYTLVYLPGTKIYDEAIKNNWIKDKTKDIYLKGIAGIEDNIYNRILFLIAVTKERGITIPEQIIDHIITVSSSNLDMAKGIINFIISSINGIEKHHNVNLEHAALHPYLTGFNEWTKTIGDVGKKVLFRSYHQSYG